MRLLSSVAILLDATDLGDRDRIVTFLTPLYGKKRGVARGARQKYSRYAGCLQTLSRVELGWFEREERDLVQIRDLSLLKVADWLDRDLESILLGSYLAEHVSSFAQDNEASESLFRLLGAVSDGLSKGLDLDTLTRYFELWALRLAGIFPPPVSCPLCELPYDSSGAVLSPSGDSLVCRRCEKDESGQVVARPVLDLMLTIGRQSPEVLAGSAPPKWQLRQIEALTRSIRRRFLGQELRSYDVMLRTLGEVGSGS